MRIALLCLALAVPAAAGESAQFLKIGLGARAIGMGGAYTAVSNDVSAMAWNPAGLSFLSKKELGAMHAELAADTHYDFVGYAQPLALGTVGIGAAHLSQGDIQGRDSSGRITGGFGAADTAVHLSYGMSLGARLRVGGNLKYIRSSIATALGESAAVDAGGIYELGPRGGGIPQIGVAVQNLGPGMKFLDSRSPLPLTLAAGVGYRLPMGLTVALDYKRRPYARSSEVSVGMEYALLSNFALRSGYASNHGPLSGLTRASDLTGFATGFGLRAFGYSLDYAITPFGGLGNAQRFSLGARF